MARSLTILSLSVLSVSALSGCVGWGLETDPPWADTDDTAVDTPDIVITPSVLSFDIAASEGPVVRTLTLENTGSRAVRVRGTAPVDTQYFENVDPLAAPIVVPAQGEATLQIRFSPPHGGTFTGRLPLRADDANGVSEIALNASVTGPKVTASSEIVPATPQWCPREASVQLRNDGPDEMPIHAMRLVEVGEQRGCASFSLRPEEVSRLEQDGVANGELLNFPLDFRPLEPAPLTCTLEIETSLAQPVRVPLGGQGELNPRTEVFWNTSDGSSANVLLIHDDGAADVEGHRERLRSGLGELLRALDIAGVKYRIAAPSSGNGCSIASPSFGLSGDPEIETRELLEEHLFDPEQRYADEPLHLMALAAESAPGCFPGWLKSPDPLHVIIVSARRDESGLTVDSWVEDVRDIVPNTRISVVTPQSGCGPTTPRLSAAARGTGGAVYDLCAADWDRTWVNLAAATAELRAPNWEATLASQPLADSVRVRVDRVRTEAWSLDTDGRTIVLEPQFEDGAEVSVQYAGVETCSL